jgi:hypothetical protein
MLERLKEPAAGAGLNPADDSTVERRRFEAFLAAQGQAPVSDAKKEELFREYLEWSSSRQSPK